MKELGQYLKRQRGNRSLREAARLTGLSHSYISLIEQGCYHPNTGADVKPTPETLKQFASGYRCSYEKLMELAGFMNDADTYRQSPSTQSDEKRIRELLKENESLRRQVETLKGFLKTAIDHMT